MAVGSSLDACLARRAEEDLPPGVRAVVLAVAETAREIGERVSLGLLAGDLAASRGGANAGGDAQKALDVLANDRFIAALRSTPVAFVASEEDDEPVVLDPEAPLAVAIDPLDGSSNIDTNISIGTIFSVAPARAPDGAPRAPLDAFLTPGSGQLAAGFVIYGPQTSLALTLGRGVQIFILDRAAGAFRLAAADVALPAKSGEYAINASNYRHWDETVRAYIDDCIQGSEGPHGENFNMRWIASLVAEAYRILVRGGVFLYPGDRREGYGQGRLRLVYEANPIAFLIEQAGGAATDGAHRILDVAPEALHQRTPFVFGSTDKVESIARYHAGPSSVVERSPLFNRRGLLRV